MYRTNDWHENVQENKMLGKGHRTSRLLGNKIRAPQGRKEIQLWYCEFSYGCSDFTLCFYIELLTECRTTNFSFINTKTVTCCFKYFFYEVTWPGHVLESNSQQQSINWSESSRVGWLSLNWLELGITGFVVGRSTFAMWVHFVALRCV